MFTNLKKIGLSAALLVSSAVLFNPIAASARDRDDYRYGRHEDRRDWREHQRHEFREHEGRESQFRNRYYNNGYYNNGYYTNGYYNNGYYNNAYPVYRNGYYDRLGCWHSYGY
jgi:hypothetical protein